MNTTTPPFRVSREPDPRRRRDADRTSGVGEASGIRFMAAVLTVAFVLIAAGFIGVLLAFM